MTGRDASVAAKEFGKWLGIILPVAGVLIGLGILIGDVKDTKEDLAKTQIDVKANTILTARASVELTNISNGILDIKQDLRDLRKATQ